MDNKNDILVTKTSKINIIYFPKYSIHFIGHSLLVLFILFVIAKDYNAFAQQNTRFNKEYLQQLESRIWQMEERLNKRPDDFITRKQLMQLKEQYLQQLQSIIEDMEKLYREKSNDISIMQKLIQLKDQYINQLESKCYKLEQLHIITFEVTTKKQQNAETEDQLTIVFSDKSAEDMAFPDFGNSVIEEFSFSGYDVINDKTLKLTRKVRDLSFLNAHYIRILNHGTDGWHANEMSLYLDGKLVLKNIKIYPNTGPNKSEYAIENFNKKYWNDRSYWEMDLQKAFKGY
jgi:archaellum component FlaC